eukprot:383353-Alexandrium_andersonii.AAC.1
MSASLVGSEMCIRDRGERATESPSSEVLPSASGPRARRAGARRRRGRGAVSYTHLTLPTICSV